MGQQRERNTELVDRPAFNEWEKARRQEVIGEILAEARAEHDFYDRAIKTAKKKSALDQDGKRRPLVWFVTRRTLLKQKWGF